MVLEVLNTKSVRDLQSFVGKIERLESQKAGIGADITDTYKQAESTGFDKKVLRRLIRERKRDRESIKLEQELLENYRDAMEMPGFDAACREAEGKIRTQKTPSPSIPPEEGVGSADAQYKVISLAHKTIEQLKKIQENGGKFSAVKPVSDMKIGKRLEEQGFLESVKEGVWKITPFGEAQIPEMMV